jgi:hypothetical protein
MERFVYRPINADKNMGPHWQSIHGDHTRHIAPTAEPRNVMTRCRSHSRLFSVRIELYTWRYPLSLLKHFFQSLSGGVHHWDENGLRDSEREPKEIRQIHNEMIEFVKGWLEDWEMPSVTKKALYDQSAIV